MHGQAPPLQRSSGLIPLGCGCSSVPAHRGEVVNIPRGGHARRRLQHGTRSPVFDQTPVAEPILHQSS
eukprot:6610602-Pyramimonas_sp.AAC.1